MSRSSRRVRRPYREPTRDYPGDPASAGYMGSRSREVPDPAAISATPPLRLVCCLAGYPLAMWFDTWESIRTIVVTGVVGYIALLALLRSAGKRTLSKMNAYDFVVTVALGSVFGTVMMSATVPIVDGVIALAVLIGLQWIVSKLYVSSRWFESIIKGKPQLLYWRGDYLDDVLKRERLAREEVHMALRAGGVSDHRAAAVVLETNGELTVVAAAGDEFPKAMSGVRTS